MISRGYNPKKIPDLNRFPDRKCWEVVPWQTLEQQIEVLKGKHCNCKI